MSFSKQIDDWAKKTKTAQFDIVSAAYKNVCTMIVSSTPVGDITLWASEPSKDYRPGKLANNWHAGIGASMPSTTSRPPDASASDSLGNIRVISGFAPGNIAWLINPEPHARPNEYGHSTQAPQGMVRITVAKFKKIVEASARGAS